MLSPEQIEELQAKQQLLAVRQVLGHTYGISLAAVRQLQAAGKVAIIDLDKVTDAIQLRASGFKVRIPRNNSFGSARLQVTAALWHSGVML